MFGSTLLALGFLLAGSIAQTRELPVQRLHGDRALTAADEKELARLIAPHGKPWLILEPVRGQFVDSWHALVYLQPTDDNGIFRRGRAVSLMAKSIGGKLDLQKWSTSGFNYAQASTEGTTGLSRDSLEIPFTDAHRLPDADLLSVIAFVRGCPCQPESGPMPEGLHGKRRISSVQIGSDGVIEVGVQRDRLSGWVLSLRRNNGTWRLLKIGFVIA